MPVPATAASTARSIAAADAARSAARSDRPARPRRRARTPRSASRRSAKRPRRQAWSSRSRGCCGRPCAIEIGRSGGGGEALDARPDRHRDHVLLQPLVVADAGVAAGRQHVDEAVLDDHLQPDVRIGGEEGRHDRGQHEPRRADRHVEPSVPAGRSRKPLTTSSAASTSPSAGPSRSSRRAPASVGTTLRVVRLSSLTPSWSPAAAPPRSGRRR